MINRTTLAGLVLALTAPCWAVPNDVPAIREARTMAVGGQTALSGGYDGGAGGSGPIDLATAGALKTGGLTVTEAGKGAPALIAEVPAPKLGKDTEGAKSNKGGSFFGDLFSGKGLMFSLGGAVVGAGAGFLVGGSIGAIGGPIGAVIGGLVGAVAGFLLSKLLS